MSQSLGSHNKLGLKGFYSTLCALLNHFWWPSLADDVRWYIKSCHECVTDTSVHLFFQVQVLISRYDKWIRSM